MPVIDHGQHDSTKKDSQAHRYGCWNRPDEFEPYTIVQDGWRVFGADLIPRRAEIEFRMSHECRYDRSETDPACAGCKHIGSGAAYIRRQEEGGAK